MDLSHEKQEYELAKADPVLATLLTQLERPVVISTGDVFHDLVSCIVEQQIHYRSTKKTFQKILDKAGIERLSPENFPVFEERALAQAKLSESKLATLAGLLDFRETFWPDWHTMSDAEVIAKLSTVKGIGRWTMDMILLYTLQRPAVFPADDFHLKQIMVTLYGLNPESRLKAQMNEVAAAWGEHQSLAVLYLLAWKESQKKR